VVLGVTITAESLSWKGAGHAGQQAKLRLYRTIVLHYYLCCIACFFLLCCIIFVVQYFFYNNVLFLPPSHCAVQFCFVLHSTIFWHSTLFLLHCVIFAQHIICSVQGGFALCSTIFLLHCIIFVVLQHFCCAVLFLLPCIIFVVLHYFFTPHNFCFPCRFVQWSADVDHGKETPNRREEADLPTSPLPDFGWGSVGWIFEGAGTSRVEPNQNGRPIGQWPF
jgi:hypothetical protein